MANEIIDPIEIIYESKCYDCVHRLTRVIEPATPDDIAFYMDAIDIDPDDDYDLLIEQHKCLVTDEDLDGIVRECSKYEPKHKFSLIRNYKF